MNGCSLIGVEVGGSDHVSEGSIDEDTVPWVTRNGSQIAPERERGKRKRV